MTNSIIHKGAVTSYCIFIPFNRILGGPARQPAAWIHTEIPIPLPQSPCYHPQRFHCKKKNEEDSYIIIYNSSRRKKKNRGQEKGRLAQ